MFYQYYNTKKLINNIKCKEYLIFDKKSLLIIIIFPAWF
jgi:hypothetical protein